LRRARLKGRQARPGGTPFCPGNPLLPGVLCRPASSQKIVSVTIFFRIRLRKFNAFEQSIRHHTFNQESPSSSFK
jgi:hypothetical protein